MRTPLLILAVAVGLLAVSRLAAPPAGDPLPQRPRPAAGAPIVLSASDPAGGREDDGEPATKPPTRPTAVSRAARAFLTAYLRWEAGSHDPAVIATVRRIATPSLWHDLKAGRGQPDPPRPMTPARVAALVPGAQSDRRAAAVLATLRRHGGTSGLALVLHRDRAGWRVAGLGP